MSDDPGDGQRLPETASVHESTLQKVARGEHLPPRRVRRRTSRKAEVTTIRVNPEVWAAALELAASPRHIQVISEDEVIVWNHDRPWPVQNPPGDVNE